MAFSVQVILAWDWPSRIFATDLRFSGASVGLRVRPSRTPTLNQNRAFAMIVATEPPTSPRHSVCLVFELGAADAPPDLAGVRDPPHFKRYEGSRDLSARRAKAVVAELTTKYGISNERLFPFGVSFAAPLSSNETEEGRAKNRRVELVKM